MGHGNLGMAKQQEKKVKILDSKEELDFFKSHSVLFPVSKAIHWLDGTNR